LFWKQIAEFPSNIQEAIMGQMKSLDKLQRFDQAITSARKVLAKRQDIHEKL
jgi:hypothetical protein